MLSLNSINQNNHIMLHTLYLSKFGFESSLSHTQSAVETYKATRANKNSSLFLGRKLDLYNDGREYQHVYSREVGYGGERELTHVGTLNHTEKTYTNNHGYYEPHPTGKKLARYTKKLGYSRH